jgi:small subunit ribosomal protein S9
MAAKETKTKVKPAKQSKPKDYIFAVGRRKEASARIRLFNGKGENTVNGKPMKDYFPGAVNAYIFTQAMKTVDVSDKHYVTVKVAGGGIQGQVEAVSLGIARALEKSKKEHRPALKKAGLLSRDPRVRERRKVGTGGKARRKKQSPKR